jgi:conserved oligomeric Golgi complex subunit 6
MATTIAFKVEVDGGQSIKELSAIEQQFEDINKSVDENNISLASSKKAIKEYTDIALQAGRTSPIGQEALKRAAQLRDQVGDLSNEVSRLAQDGQAMQGALALGETVVAGYGAFQGVIALVGQENEQLLETIAKLQAAQSVLMGIERIRLALEKESVLMLQARVLWTKATTVATNLYSAATKAATVATNALKIAMGIGIFTAIAAAIAAIAMNWDKVTKALGFNEDAHTKATAAYLKNADQRIEAINKEIAKQQESYDILIARLKVENKDATDAINARANLSRDAYQAEIHLIEQSIAANQKAMQSLNEESAGYKALATQIDKLQKVQVGYQFELDKLELARRENIRKSVEAIDKQRADELAANQKLTAEQQAEYQKRLDAAAAAKQKELELEKQLQQDLEDILAESIEDPNIRRLAQLELSHEREKQRLIEQYGERTELMKALEEKQSQEMTAAIDEIETMAREEKYLKDEERRLIEEEAAIEAFNLRLAKEREDGMALIQIEDELLEFKYQNGLIKESEYIEQKAVLVEREKDMVEKAAQAMNQARLSTIGATANALGAISGLMKKGSKEAKGFAVAQLALNTAQSIGNVITGATSAAAAGGPAAPFLLAAYIASGLATVLSAIGQAKSILGDSSSTPTPSYSAPSVSAPSSSFNQPANTGGVGTSTENAQQQSQVQVVVLASEVSDVNNQNQSIELASVF